MTKAKAQRISGLNRMVAEVHQIVAESGNSEGFNARAWVKQWLNQPTPALGGQRPADLMRSASGRQQVLKLIKHVQSGAYN